MAGLVEKINGGPGKGRAEQTDSDRKDDCLPASLACEVGDFLYVHKKSSGVSCRAEWSTGVARQRRRVKHTSTSAAAFHIAAGIPIQGRPDKYPGGNPETDSGGKVAKIHIFVSGCVDF